MIWIRSLDLTQEDGDEAEESVECQETFLHSFLILPVRDLGQGFFLLICETFSSDCISHTGQPFQDASDSTWAIWDPGQSQPVTSQAQVPFN